MSPPEHRRPIKRKAISDQQRRRDLTLERQAQSRRDAHLHARCLASTVLSLQSHDSPEPEAVQELDIELEPAYEYEIEEEESGSSSKDLDVNQASRLKGAEARKWFARQLMLPEWMIDVPDRLSQDWYIFARPTGKRCFVVSSNGSTVSRLRNGSILHRFPSSLPNGSRKRGPSGPAQSYSILDCIFHELDQTYYVMDMVCWRGYSLYDCSTEFRFFWLNSKLGETGACDPPSHYHKYRFSAIPVHNCDQDGLYGAYMGAVPYVKDGLLLYNKVVVFQNRGKKGCSVCTERLSLHAHYQPGNTPLALVWKDEKCSQYVIDTDKEGQVPSQQQIVLELQVDGKLSTSDDDPVVFGCLDGDFVQKSGLRPGSLLRFAICEGGLNFVDGKLEKADLQYLGKVNHARAFADSYSKVMFQHAARHSPLKIDDLLESINAANVQVDKPGDAEMVG